jgi:hypothetical protein
VTLPDENASATRHLEYGALRVRLTADTMRRSQDAVVTFACVALLARVVLAAAGC